MADPLDLAGAIRLFDETTTALSAQVRRLEEVLTAKQEELVETNRRLHEQVAERERLAGWLNLIMGSVASGVVAIDVHGRVTTINEAAATLLRTVLPDPVDADYVAGCPDSPAVAVLASGRAVPREERSLRGPEGVRRVLATASPLRDADGVLIGAVEVLDDVTDLRRLEEQVHRADRLKQLGEMAAGVAHEIRNPLNGIEGFASLLARDAAEGAGDAARVRRYAEAIVSGVRDLNRTVSGLLEFTRARRLERRACDPVELAKGCIELVRAESASLAGAALIDGEDPRPAADLRLGNRWPVDRRASIDPAQVRQVLLNLVQNAVQAAGEGGRSATVEITVALEDDWLAFTVDDDGPGVPQAERSRIFTPFFTTRAHGTGLGLAVAHTIVNQHGGSISVDEAPMGGARFRFTLPT